MEFDNSFEVPLKPAEAWTVLMDIRRIAPCMPGAELTEVVDEKNYKGKVGVRLGPVALAFAGLVTFEEIDDASRTARVKAQGTDSKGRGGANALASFRVEDAPGGGSKNVPVYGQWTAKVWRKRKKGRSRGRRSQASTRARGPGVSSASVSS